VNVAVEDPPTLRAVIANVVAEATEFGVPVSNPVEVLKLNPEGAAGDIENEVTVSPVTPIV
jgi:hypothetical protein